MRLVLHLLRFVRALPTNPNRSHCHQSLDGNVPEPRPVEDGDSSVSAIPNLGGLHHEYRRAD